MSDTIHASTTRFGHHRLDAYRVAMDLFLGVEAVAAGFPKGYADLKDQVRRAAAATVRNIAEGANRGRDKMIKARRALYLGNKWVLLVCTLVFFPLAVLLFTRHAVWIEQEITPEQLADLQAASD